MLNSVTNLQLRYKVRWEYLPLAIQHLISFALFDIQIVVPTGGKKSNGKRVTAQSTVKVH